MKKKGLCLALVAMLLFTQSGAVVYAESINASQEAINNIEKITGTSDMKKVTDLKGNPLLLFVNAWSVGMTEDRNPNLVLTEFSK